MLSWQIATPTRASLCSFCHDDDDDDSQGRLELISASNRQQWKQGSNGNGLPVVQLMPVKLRWQATPGWHIPPRIPPPLFPLLAVPISIANTHTHCLTALNRQQQDLRATQTEPRSASVSVSAQPLPLLPSASPLPIASYIPWLI